MDFNLSPYFDDFDENNEFYKILFRPGAAVQAREMNQLQSILQNQVAKVGDHLFKDGSMVIPGNVQYNDKLNYLKVDSVSLGTDDAGAALSLDYLEDKVLVQNTDGTGVNAIVVKAIPANAATGDPITLVVLYNSNNETPDGVSTDKVFQPSSTIYVKDETTRTIAVNGSLTYSGRSVVANVQEGIFYLAKHFVKVQTQKISVKTYADIVSDINARIGIKFTESIVTSDTDSTLFDNANGTPNFAAPGAHRYKITAEFIQVDLNDSPENFYELIRIEDGVLQSLQNKTQYNILEETLARRTYDESGNYVVQDFKFDLREARNNNRGKWSATQVYQARDLVYSNVSSATTRYFECIQGGTSGSSEPAGLSNSSVDELTVVTDNSVKWRYISNPVGNRGVSVDGSSSNLTAVFGLGRAYVQGYEINKVANSNLTIAKGRDVVTENNRSIFLPQGNYVYVDKKYTWGLPDIRQGPAVELYDRFADLRRTKQGYGQRVGSARIIFAEPDARGAIRLGLTDINMLPNKGFDRDANSIIIPDAVTSNVTTTSFTQTGLIEFPGSAVGLTYLPLGERVNFTAQLSGSTLTVTGAGNTQFSKSLRVGDNIVIGGTSSHSVTCSYTVISIASDTTMTVSGPALTPTVTDPGTSLFVRVAANTVVGLATSVLSVISTNFQAEYRPGDVIYLGTATAANTATVIAVQSDNRMFVSSTGITAGTRQYQGSAHGQYHSGRSATFSADVFGSYANGINARKLTGLYSITNFSGGATTITIGNAIRINGTNDAKLLSELAVNDYVNINNNRIFVTKISSNTIAYGVSFDGNTVGASTTYPAFRINNNLNDTKYSTLLFPVATATNSITDNQYTIYKCQTGVTVTLSATTCVVTLDSASGTAAAEQPSYNPADYLVSTDTFGAASTSYNISAVSVAGNNITLTTTGTWASTALKVIYPVIRGAATNTDLGRARTKTLTFNYFDTYLTTSEAIKTTLALSKTDGSRIVKVLQASTFVAAWTDVVAAAATDVTNRYVLDNGQRDSYYGAASAVLKAGFPPPSGSIRVYYDYYEHGAGDFFARSSYDTTTTPYETIPSYRGQNLGDVLDFRTSVNPSTGLLTGSAPPKFNTAFTADISYYLGRKEMIFLDRSGEFYSVSGAPDKRPQNPRVTESTNAINLYNIEVKPYTRSSEYPDVTEQKIDNRRYTMKDIGRIEKRVANLEETTALSLLESKASGLQIRDNLDSTLERYKTGFFVDNFQDATNADLNGDTHFTIDFQNQILNPWVEYNSIPLVEKINYTASTFTSSELVFLNAARSVENYKITGDLLTLNYTTANLIKQDLATTSISVAPFLNVSFIGNLNVHPSTDVYENITTVNKVAIDDSKLTPAGLAEMVARYRASGDRRPYTVGVETVTVFTGTTTKTDFVPFCRANTLLIRGYGFKPNTKVYPFFDDLPVEDYCTGAVKLTFDSMPVLDFTGTRANAKTEWPRWRGLAESIDVQEVVRSRLVSKNKKGETWVYDYGWFRRAPKPKDFHRNLPSAVNRDAFRKALEVGPVVYYYESGKVVGSAVAVHQEGTTLFLVNGRGKLADSFIRSAGTVSYAAGVFYVSVDGADPKYVNTTVTAAGALTQDSSGFLYTDVNGTVICLFDLPDTDTLKFLSGLKPVVITDSPDNDPDLWFTRGAATYYVEGYETLITRNYMATKTYAARPYDPIAQSFSLPSQYTNGAFITDIDIFFQAKPSKEAAPVMLEIRSCDSTGRPSADELLPGTGVVKMPADITVDATRGRIPTKFTFDAPVYLMPGKNYAMVLRSDSTNYRVWVATLGQNDVVNASSSYNTQATFGSLFKSQDGILWTEDQLTDIKFTINRAVFSTADAGATFRCVNHTLNSELLPNNPLTFEHGSNKIRVGHKNHGFASGDTVRLYSPSYGAEGLADSTRRLNNIPYGEILGNYISSGTTLAEYRSDLAAAASHSRLLISDVTYDTYTVTVSSLADLGATAITGLTTVAQGGGDWIGLSNKLYQVVKPNVRALTFEPTTLSMNARMLRGFDYDNDAETRTGPYSWISKPLNINTHNILDTSCIILAEVNEYDRVDTSYLVSAGLGGPQVWTNSFIGEITLATADDAVSPAIDLSTLNLDTVQHRIDNPTYANRIGTFPTIFSTSDLTIIDLICSGNTTVSFDGNLETINTATPGLFSNIVPGRYISVNGSVLNTNTSVGILVTGVNETGTTIFTSSLLTTEQAGSSITILQFNDFTDEATTLAGSADSKFITKVINLVNPATQIKLLIEACVPSVADFDIYYKIGASTTNFDNVAWTKYIAPFQSGTTSSYVNIVKSDVRGVFTDIEFNISNYDAQYNTIDLTPFTAFQIKLVMRSSNAARIPQFRNLRAIAHA